MQQYLRRILISFGVNGLFESTFAMAPETIGADMDVPLFTEYEFPVLLQEYIYEPFTISSGFTIHSLVGPRPEKKSFPSGEPTVMILWQVPGIATECLRGPSLPAAATTDIFSSQSFSIACSRAL